MLSAGMGQNLKKSERGVAMTEYAIVFVFIVLPLALALNEMFSVNAAGEISLNRTLPSLNITNPLYGFQSYYHRVTDFLALPIP